MVISFWSGESGQTVQTQIRLLLEEQSDLGLYCLLEEQSDLGLHCIYFICIFFDKIPLGLGFLFEF